MKGPAPREAVVFGRNAGAGLVAADPEPGDARDTMVLRFRRGGSVETVREPFEPFLWIEDAKLLEGCDTPSEVRKLEGEGALRACASFPTWKALEQAVAWLRRKTGRTPTAPDAPYFLVNDEVQQHLMRTGRTFFKELDFAGLRRMQVDIETFTGDGFEFPNARRESDRILAIGLADSGGWSLLLDGSRMDERAMLAAFVEAVRERDPDVLEGHNLFAFDLPYLVERARRHRVRLALGRDGGTPSVRSGRFGAGDRSFTYPRTDLAGRSVIDTYFLAQIYDASHRSLPGLGLKEIARHFGFASADRTYIEGAEVGAVFQRDPARVMAYLADDVRETAAVAALLSPVYFAQAQIVPMSYQNVAVRGSASKIDAMLLREYLARGAAIPAPGAARPFEGGYTDIFFTGVARPVHHCDARSLYPSIMLAERLGPAADREGVFLTLLEHLRDFRLAAKDRARGGRSEGERALADALQSAFKILINSFYGYLGFDLARFNDFAAAERVTARGREILKRMLETIRTAGGQPVEIDTDGVYFVPPSGPGAPAADAFRRRVQSALPEGIEVEFDGEYEAMFSYKMKNYALLDASGEILIKGAALKSRGLEPFQREFIEEALALKLHGRDAEIRALADRYRRAIEAREWPVHQFARTERLQDSPATYAAARQGGGRARNAAYELALASGREYRAGDAISYYVTGTKKNVAVYSSAKRVDEWDPGRRDENVAYYVAKLEDLAARFVSAPAGDPSQGELGL